MTRGLAGPGAILVVSCYELGHAPHGLAMPAGFLERAGYRPRLIDLSLQELPDEAVAAARVVVLSVPMHTALRLALEVAAQIRARNPDCRLIFAGLYAPLNAELLADRGADAILGGEWEQLLVDRLVEIESAAVADPGPRVSLEKLDFAAPVRDGLEAPARYAHMIDADGDHHPVGYSETSRGCLDRCRHCPVPAIYGGRFFVVPRQVVLDDIARQVDSGAEHITFGDPDFLNGPGHSLAVVRELHRRWPELTFDITAQVTHLLAHADRLPELVASGCSFAVTAVESLSDRVLTNLAKRHRRPDVDRLIELAATAGLVLRPTFVTFTPWTTLDDLVELVDYLVDRRLVANVDPVQLTIRLLVPPGSLLLEHHDCFGSLDPAALTHRWRHDDPRVDTLAQELAAIAESVAGSGDPSVTFAAMRTAIYRAAQLQPRPLDLPRRRVPRVSEPWFC